MNAFARCVLLVIFLWLIVGCSSRTHSSIVPLAEIAAATPSAATREARSVILPTPQAQNAPQGHYQDDDGLRLAIAKVGTQAISQASEDERGVQYVILTVALTNYGSHVKDVTGFPFTVWLRDATASESYAPEVYAPSEDSLWEAIDKLNKGTAKHLGVNQTVRGELFFRVPASTQKVDLIWQPNAQRQWILSVPKLR